MLAALIKGKVKIDGEPLTRQNVKRICLVQQTDAFFENLTLKQTLNYAANLRLDSSLSRTDKQEIVNKVIKTLDLEVSEKAHYYFKNSHYIH